MTTSMEATLEKIARNSKSILSPIESGGTTFLGSELKIGNCVDKKDVMGYVNNPMPYIGYPASLDIDYKFNETILLDELREYIDKTYDEHYSTSKIQTTEFIIDQGYGAGFCAGNVLKYTNRYGKKAGYNRKDILKTLHYALILLHVHDLEHSDE